MDRHCTESSFSHEMLFFLFLGALLAAGCTSGLKLASGEGAFITVD